MFDQAREEDVLRRVISACGKDMPENAVRQIFTEIISAARSVQQTLVVSFLGPEGTFCHQAALNIFGHSTTLRSADTIAAVFDLVEKGVCRQGVVPVENSYEGSVNNTLDLLYKYDLKITAEAFLRIRHHLLGMTDGLKGIDRFYSHPMAMSQCRLWIRENLPGVPIGEMESTSTAAKRAAEEPGAAAIGSRMSARTYNLNIIQENIEDNPNNITRFLIIGKNDAAPTGKDKTSLVFSVSHKPGALNKVLEALALRHINMNRIESRPIRTRNWEYLFFVDIEGHEQDDNVREAIREMGEGSSFMKNLGSYPAGGKPWD